MSGRLARTKDVACLTMQPLATANIRRPFHWGIVVVSDVESGGLIPDVDPERAVSANENGIVALIRHAQDIDSFEGEFDWAEAEVLVRLLTEAEPPSPDRREVFRGRLKTPTGRISVGDADGEVVHPAHHGWNEVVVTVASDVNATDLSPDAIRIDLLPGG
jgi:hypothetical protein